MFKRYWKTLFTVIVAVGWLWSLGTGMAAVSSKSDIGVALGLGGIVTSSFLAIWLFTLIFKGTRKKDATSQQSSTGGAEL